MIEIPAELSAPTTICLRPAYRFIQVYLIQLILQVGNRIVVSQSTMLRDHHFQRQLQALPHRYQTHLKARYHQMERTRVERYRLGIIFLHQM